MRTLRLPQRSRLLPASRRCLHTSSSLRAGFPHSSPSASSRPELVILAATRTPIGCFNSSLASLTAPALASHTIKHALSTLPGLSPSSLSEVLLGNVLSAGVGQAPATQAALLSGIPSSVPSTTINKVCSSGMKTVMVACGSIVDGTNEAVLCGGMESMSNTPYYLQKARRGYGYGHGQLLDGVLKDGLWDALDDHHMGDAAELTARKYGISRQQQDDYAIESYERAQRAQKAGFFAREITPVPVAGRKGDVTLVKDDEEPGNLRKDKVSSLKPVFSPQGTITAANSSPLSDGASCVIVSSLAFARAHGLTPLARIVAYADAQKDPVDFPTAPALAIPLALKRAGLSSKDVDAWEINEAFSAVAIANRELLGIDGRKLNQWGGAVSLGHPLGSSGSRIIVTLLSVLKETGGKVGVAGICNGGGGASAIVVERWQ